MKKIDFVDYTCIIQFFLKVSQMNNSCESEAVPSVSQNFVFSKQNFGCFFTGERYEFRNKCRLASFRSYKTAGVFYVEGKYKSPISFSDIKRLLPQVIKSCKNGNLWLFLP